MFCLTDDGQKSLKSTSKQDGKTRTHEPTAIKIINSICYQFRHVFRFRWVRASVNRNPPFVAMDSRINYLFPEAQSSIKTKTRSTSTPRRSFTPRVTYIMTFFILKSAILTFVYISSVCAFDVPFLRGSAGVSLSYLLSVASNFEAPIALTISDTTLLFL